MSRACMSKLVRLFKKKMKVNIYKNKDILFVETNNKHSLFFFEIIHIGLAKNKRPGRAYLDAL